MARKSSAICRHVIATSGVASNVDNYWPGDV
jgi:hypothetical protein